MFNSSKSSLNTIHRLTPPKKGKQELIVQVNIGKKGQSKSIKIYDLHNMSNVQEQIKLFIKANGLKETAFSYIKEIIAKQISQRKQEIYYECHSRCTNNCKCSNKHHRFEEKQKDILEILSSNDFSRKSTRKGMSVVRQPKHLQIKITTPKVDKLANKHQEMSSFVFNSSFTLPSSVGQKQRCFLTDELFENVLETSQNRSSAYFSSMSEFKTKERQQDNKIMVNTQRIDIQKDNQNEIAVKPLESSFKKNSIIKMVTPSKATKRQSLDKPKFTCITPLAYKKNKNISTKQRKIALMTPQQTPKTSQTPKSDLIHLNSQSLELMVMEHKKFLKQTNCGSITTNDNSDLIIPVFPQKNVPLVFQSILENLFAKLTTNNPPQIKQINSQYVSYQLLQREQLDFMGILFQKIDHRQLNNLNYLNFRNNSLKHCWKQLQELIKRYSNIS